MAIPHLHMQVNVQDEMGAELNRRTIVFHTLAFHSCVYDVLLIEALGSREHCSLLFLC